MRRRRGGRWSFFPEERRYVERSGSERVNGRLITGSSSAAAMSACRLRQGSGPPHVRHDRSEGQPTDAPHRSADLVRLVSFAITVAALLERRCGQTRPKFDENTESEAVPTLIRPWSPSKSHQLPCADVVASLGVLAPLRIDQSFASGSGVLFSRLPLSAGKRPRQASTFEIGSIGGLLQGDESPVPRSAARCRLCDRAARWRTAF